jgi:RNA polymerase subunit RPABC4/transcription elongation factor Spt4
MQTYEGITKINEVRKVKCNKCKAIISTNKQKCPECGVKL